MLQRLYFVESLQKTLVHKNTCTKNKFSMGFYYVHSYKKNTEKKEQLQTNVKYIIHSFNNIICAYFK